MSVENAVRSAFNSKNENEVKLRDVASSLRISVLNSKHYPLPDDIKLQNIFKGEIDIPEELIFFLTHLIKGPDSRSGNTVQKSRRIKSIAQDIIFAVTGGVVKPSKHLVLGLALTKLTSSRKVIEILNRLGHITNYHLLEEIETELTMQLSEERKMTPHDMKLLPFPSGLALDNYDRYVETLNGKHTLHDTVGIMY